MQGPQRRLPTPATESFRRRDRVTFNFVYTEAHHLHFVRRRLQESGVLRSITSHRDAKSLKTGDFGEFQTWFRPNQETPES